MENHPTSCGSSKSVGENVLTQADITKYQTGRLEQKTFFPHGAGGEKSQTQVPAGLGSGDSSLPGLQTAAFRPCSLSSMCAREGSQLRCLFLFLYGHESCQGLF